jgi:hypothetical protein
MPRRAPGVMVISAEALPKIEHLCAAVLSRAKFDSYLRAEARDVLELIRGWCTCEPGGPVPKFQSKAEMKAYIKNRISKPEA